MGLYSAAMLAEVSKRTPEVYPVLTLSLPSGTKRYGGVNSTSLGLFENKILTWGGAIDFSLSLTSGRLGSVDATVILDDTDRAFAKEIEGAGANALRGSVATIRLASPNVAEGDWLTLLTGTLFGWSQAEPLQWTLTIRPNAQPLKGLAPKVLIDHGDWLNAPATSLGQIAPLIYGIHDSAGGAGDGGMVPAILVDPSTFTYLLARWRLKSVPRVYVDGAQVASGWEIQYPTKNGRQFTVIAFTTSQGDAAITADVQGYETVGDGSGSVITDPVAQFAHLLDHAIFGDHQAGNWVAQGTNAPIDATSFTAATAYFATARGYKGSRRIAGSQRSGEDLVNEVASSLEVKLYWTYGGKIGIAILDPALTGIYTDTGWLRGDQDEIDWGGQQQDPDTVRDRITASFLFNSTQGAYLQTIEARDPSITEQSAETISLPWSHAALS
jgi:hypothetical protein